MSGKAYQKRKAARREGWCMRCNEREADETYPTCEYCRILEREYKRVVVWCEDCQFNAVTGHRWDCPTGRNADVAT